MRDGVVVFSGDDPHEVPDGVAAPAERGHHVAPRQQRRRRHRHQHRVRPRQACRATHSSLHKGSCPPHSEAVARKESELIFLMQGVEVVAPVETNTIIRRVTSPPIRECSNPDVTDTTFEARTMRPVRSSDFVLNVRHCPLCKVWFWSRVSVEETMSVTHTTRTNQTTKQAQDCASRTLHS